MHKGLVVLACFSLVCFVLHLIPILSVPVTSNTNGIYLAKLEGYTFGILGICDTTTNKCSDISVGYPSKNSSFFLERAQNEQSFALPTRAILLISRLLVVHIVAFCLSSCHLVVTVFLLVLLWFDQHQWKRCRIGADNINDDSSTIDLEADPTISRVHSRNSSVWSSSRSRIGHRRIVEFEERRSHNNNNTNSISNKVVEDGGEDDDDEDQPRDISMYLSFMLMFSLCDFIATLLALLADILLFIPRLTYVGWIQILPLILLAFTASTICFMKREVSTRKYLQGGDSNYKNDDMYLRRRMVTDPDNDDDDSGSDDGFYVYTNGFYSNSDKDSQWVHHGRRSTTTIDQTMDIPLDDLHTHEQHTDEFDDDDYNDNEDNDGYVH